MCELMGMSFDRPVVADISLRAFACRDEENPDGWGLAWYPDQSLALVKEAINWRSSGYTKFLETYPNLRARLYIAHVRKKTTGGEPTHADTHPFRRECRGRDFCFAHNGTIGIVPERTRPQYLPVGGTDSERVFCYLLDLIRERGETLESDEGFAWLHAVLVDLNQSGTLNCLMSDGVRLFAYRDCHGWKGLSLRKVRFRNVEERIFEDATTEIAVAGDSANHGCLIATRPLSGTGWHAIEPGGLVVLEGSSLRATLS